jgi:two-component system sensor kinase FixL
MRLGGVSPRCLQYSIAGRSQCTENRREIHQLPTASHKVLPMCCSAFFRTPEAFSALKAWVVEDLLDRTTNEHPARIWVPACGTGEEAYSIAMLLIEHYETYGRLSNVQIFATDLDPACIQAARAGVYTESDLVGVSPARLQRFFRACGHGRFRVGETLRSRIIFATHNLDRDPPLSRLDFIMCQSAVRQLPAERRLRLYSLLHFALNEAAHLLLNPEEVVLPPADLFQPVGAEGYVYRRLDQPPPVDLLLNEVAILAADRASWSAAAFPERRPGSLLTQEDIRCAYEDLIAPRERVQSLNEELLAINSQLIATVSDLERSCRDLGELLGESNMAVLFLSERLNLERFTAPATAMLNLHEQDVGYHWSRVARGFDEQLLIDARLALETHTPIEKSVRAPDSRCYLRRVQPSATGAGVTVTYVDITLQVESDAQLRRFAVMLRDSADAIVVTDFDGQIVAWNRGAQRLYGYTQSEALRLNIRDLMTGNQLDATLDVMRRVERGDAVPTFDIQRRTREGRMVDVSATVALLYDVAGKPESLASTERDITARRRAEDETRMLNLKLEQRVAERGTELQHSEEQTRAILDATADAVVTIDMLGRIATFNRAAERIFGYTAAEVIGESVVMLIPPEERTSYGQKATATRYYVSRLLGRSHDMSGRRKDGSIFPLLLSVNSVEGRELFVAVARDMTEHKALQKEIIDVATLEQRRIGQELHDGTQQELTGLGLLALSLSESLSRTGATAASQVAARVARGIEQCNRRVRNLARGMVPVPIDRDGLMTALAELARQTTEMHALPCSFECPTPVEIENDGQATHLYRIAQEAVTNATRHAKASAIWIRLDQIDGVLALEVHDNGVGLQNPGLPGMPAKGVGLRLMEHRCAMIGGRFLVEAKPDGGTRIVCSVPRSEEAVS